MDIESDICSDIDSEIDDVVIMYIDISNNSDRDEYRYR